MPVILVHGFPLDHSMWQHQIGPLAEHARVIAPDLPGFGASDPIEDIYPMSRFADDVAGLLDELQIDQPVLFCGLSMGGYIGWEFWQRHPQRLRGLIVCDSRAVADDAVVRKGREVAASRVLEEGVQVVVDSMLPKLFGKEFFEHHRQQVDRVRQVMEQTPPHTIAAALRGMSQRADFSSRLGEITHPALVICGEEDAISAAEEMRQIASAIPAARYVEIPAAGHMAPLERPQAVNTAMVEFLNQISG